MICATRTTLGERPCVKALAIITDRYGDSTIINIIAFNEKVMDQLFEFNRVDNNTCFKGELTINPTLLIEISKYHKRSGLTHSGLDINLEVLEVLHG